MESWEEDIQLLARNRLVISLRLCSTASAYCSAALDKCSEIPYGEVHHLQGSDEDEKHSFVFQNIYHIGDTTSAQELEVFLRMSRERLRLCCGLQCTDRLHPNGPRQRQKLYTAALKLLWFAVGIDSVQCENAAQVALHAAIRPLLRLEDGHVLATLSAIVLALCEGRTGLAISGVFGAGKTRSAAVLLAGLLVFDPSLKLMVLTKENIAAHAVAEHLVSLQMPDYIQEKMGRLDEGQQYGNMEEAATVARTPATCLEVWSGDHRQTPGGLKKSQEAKAFRKKLTKRPLALRCQTQYVQAHDFEKIVLRYLDCPKESFAWKLRQLLIDGSSAIDPAVGQFWHEHFGDSPPCLSTEIQRAAYVILWMGLRGERKGLPSMLATSFAEAAGVSGRQKWGLVLSSSARVSQVTYQTVVGVRYPELVTYNGTQWKFGKYVQQESPLPGDTSDSEGSESASDSEQNDPPSSLVADAEQYELMQIAYAAVGKDFTGQDDLIGAKYSKLLKLEMVREMAMQGYLSRCRYVWIPSTVAKCLTMKLAVYLAKEVAAILRAVLTHETKKLYNDSTVHLLCANYWVQPI
eukprot:symbB.v1.2.017213.t1/scaffold1339.1/size137066/4